MNNPRRRSLAVWLLAGTLFAAESFAADIAGRVVEDHLGEPLASARVRVRQAGQAALAADLDTDSEGRFQASGLPEGNYRLEVSKANYASVALSARGSASTTVRLVKLGVITGRVLDGKNQPIRGAYVFPRPKSGQGDSFSPMLMMERTDANGGYRLHGIAPGTYSLAVSLAGYRSDVGVGAMLYPSNANPESFTISGGEEHRGVDFVFSATSLQSISGRVVLPEAGGGYAVALVSVDQPSLSVATGQTEPDGAFRFDGVPPGSYHLFASGPVRGYGGRASLLGEDPRYGRTQVDVGGQDLQNIWIEVAAGRSVSFALASEGPLPAGACPASAALHLLPLEDRAARLMSGIRVNFTSEQRADGLAPGQYRLALGDLGERCFPGVNPVLDLESEEAPDVVKVLVAPAGAINGRLLTGSAAAVEYAVTIVPPALPLSAKAQDVQIAFPDAEGRFAFTDLRPGEYRIAVRPADMESGERWVPGLEKMFAVEVAGGTATEVELPVAKQ
jgi:hypothetical protein